MSKDKFVELEKQEVPAKPTTATHQVAPVPKEEAARLPVDETLNISTTKTVEKLAEEKQTPAWLLGAAKACNRWAEGRELTEAEYQAGLDKAAGAQMTAGNPFIERK